MEVRRAYALLEQATSRRHERQAFEIAAANHENSATLCAPSTPQYTSMSQCEGLYSKMATQPRGEQTDFVRDCVPDLPHFASLFGAARCSRCSSLLCDRSPRETSIAKSALWMSNSAEGTDAPVLARPYNEICAAWGGTSYDGYEA